MSSGANSSRDDDGFPEDDVAELIRAAGSPPELTPLELAAARRRSHAAWRSSLPVRSRRPARQLLMAALAAGVALVAAVVLFRRVEEAPAPPAGPVAVLELRTGEVRVVGPGGEGSSLVAGSSIATGGGARVAIRMSGGASVRIDGSSSVRIASDTRVELASGALYVDSGAAGAAGLEVETSLGRVTEIGTQFEVRLDAAGANRELRVRVREGEVQIGSGSEGFRARAGEELRIDAEGERVRARLAPDDPAWEWAAAAAPLPAIDGGNLRDFLDWAARETGLRWRLVEPRPELAPDEIVLHGSLEGLTPGESIEVVLAGCGLRAERRGGELLVSSVGAGGR